VFKHHLAALNGGTAGRANDVWVKATFDNFAHGFDQLLEGQLGYHVPRKLAELLMAHCAPSQAMLDLGCGTGLVGAALLGHGHVLIGVDLSPKMAKLARARGVYAQVECVEIHQYLTGCREGDFDAVVAADVFIYIGDLASVFNQVSRILRPDGFFAFSVEDLAAGDYALMPTGRYAQSRAYIEVLAASRFDIVEAATTTLRIEARIPVPGYLYVLQRV
jgi:predicted TPR repeat methyltransferase